MNLEHELQQALKRKSPPAGFDRRVLERIAAGEAVPAPGRRPRWSRLALPVAASLTLALAGGYYIRLHERQQQTRAHLQAEQAARDVVRALQIASDKVSAVQVRVQEITHHERQADY
jgi:hypothetical protein